jgi:hypothetical protein
MERCDGRFETSRFQPDWKAICSGRKAFSWQDSDWGGTPPLTIPSSVVAKS